MEGVKKRGREKRGEDGTKEDREVDRATGKSGVQSEEEGRVQRVERKGWRVERE